MTNDSHSKKKTGNEIKPDSSSSLSDNVIRIAGIVAPFAIFWMLLFGLGGAHYTLILASVLAYLSSPVVEFLSKKGFSSKFISAGLTLFVMMVIIVFLLVEVPIALSQLISLLSALPKSLVALSNFLREYLITKGLNPEIIRSGITENISQIILKTQATIVAASSQLLSITINQVQNIINILINLLLFPMLYYSLLQHHKKIGNIITNWIPTPALSFWGIIFQSGSQVLNGYLRGQGLIIVTLACAYTLGLQLLNIPFATLIGVLTGLLTIIPYVGFSIGLFLALIMGATVEPSLAKMASILGLFTMISILENVFLVPQLIGHHLGIHPVIALLAIMIGGNLFGIPGFILATPFTAMISQILTNCYPQLQVWLHLTRRPAKASSRK